MSPGSASSAAPSPAPASQKWPEPQGGPPCPPIAAARPGVRLPLGVASSDAAAGCSIRGFELLAWRRELLRASGGERSALDWLLDVGGGVSWPRLQELHLFPERRVRLRLGLEALAELWWRHRREATPLQYLIGLCPWRDLELRVGPGVLIPRQETELLVDLAVDLAASLASPIWADLGTGSGCLAVALAQSLGGTGFAVDASTDALQQAEDNLRERGLEDRVSLIRGDWWEGLRPWWGSLDLVVSNPPYIPTACIETLDPVVRQHEPRLALDGGADGLGPIRAIVADAARALAPGGRLLLEHHHDQSQAVGSLLAAAGLEAVQAHRDLEGVLRFASARRQARSIQP